jgi:Bacterial mobilisation protein (MobC)
MWVGCTNVSQPQPCREVSRPPLTLPPGAKPTQMKLKETKALSQRRQRLHIRMTGEEKNRLEDLAKEHGLTISDYVRVTITRSNAYMVKAKPEREIMIKILAELGKIGSNVNQIAYQLNRERVTGNRHSVPDGIIQQSLSGVKNLSDRLIALLSHGAES